jgi:hypothetical protein
MNMAETVAAAVQEQHLNNVYKWMELARQLGVPSLGLAEQGRCRIEFPDGSVLQYKQQFRLPEDEP